MATIRRLVERQLAWVVRFAQADLDTWRLGDWLNAYEELTRWLLAPTSSSPVAREYRLLSAQKTWDLKGFQARLRAVQAAFRALLAEVYRAKDTAAEGNTPPPIRLPLSGHRLLRWPEGGVGPLLQSVESRGGTRDQRTAREMALLLADKLSEVEVDRFRRCKECGRWFVAERPVQRFDRPRCATRRRVRAFQRRLRAARRARRRRRRLDHSASTSLTSRLPS